MQGYLQSLGKVEQLVIGDDAVAGHPKDGYNCTEKRLKKERTLLRGIAAAGASCFTYSMWAGLRI